MQELVSDTSAPGGEVISLPPPLSRTEDHRRRRRRSWTLDEKLAIVKEAEASGDPVAVVARRHDMNANHLFMWMERARQGTLGRAQRPTDEAAPMSFIDLGVVGQAAPEPAAMSVIEIELPSGVRVRVGPSVDIDALRRVLAAVKAEL
jgi:transposase-like protein